MFGPGKKQIEIDRLLEVERTLTQRAALLEEEKRILESAVSGLRDELADTRKALAGANAKAEDLLLGLEKERAMNEELRERLAERDSELAGYEEEAMKINERLDRIAAERSGFKARISNLTQTVADLRARLGQGTAESRRLDFSDLGDDPAPPRLGPGGRRPYGEPFRPQTPPTPADRDWLTDLPPF